MIIMLTTMEKTIKILFKSNNPILIKKLETNPPPSVKNASNYYSKDKKMKS